MLKLPVAQRLAFGFLGSAGHSVARMPMKPPIVVRAATTAEMSRLQPVSHESSRSLSMLNCSVLRYVITMLLSMRIRGFGLPWMPVQQPILNCSAAAVSPAARGHSTVPAVTNTPAAAANPSRPAMSKPHFTSFSFRDLACRARTTTYKGYGLMFPQSNSSCTTNAPMPCASPV